MKLRHAADEWLASLLELPVTLRLGENGEPSMVDPRGVAEQILEWRAAVATDWIERLEAVPEELVQVQREHVERTTAVG